jgi:glycosyltransferase involved in cell wall biosynthesis
MRAAREGPLVLVVANSLWSIAHFRRALISALQEAGYAVKALAPRAEPMHEIPCPLVEVRVRRKGVAPLSDLVFFLQLHQHLRRLRPFAVLTFSAKPNIYGVLAARSLGIRSICNISGLGSGFIAGGALALVLRVLYRLACRNADSVFFQNEDDRALFERLRLVGSARAVAVPGSGIDLKEFQLRPAKRGGAFVFLFVGRLLRDKGVIEFADAARLILEKHRGLVEFHVLGGLDPENPSAVSRSRLNSWVASGTIRYLGWQSNIQPAVEGADCVVLPSYREGTPRALLEASAMGRPVIATDVPGCRQVVDDGQTGLLCRPRDSTDLAAKMERMISLSAKDRATMGLAGRAKIEREFDQRLVIHEYLAALAGFRV